MSPVTRSPTACRPLIQAAPDQGQLTSQSWETRDTERGARTPPHTHTPARRNAVTYVHMHAHAHTR